MSIDNAEIRQGRWPLAHALGLVALGLAYSILSCSWSRFISSPRSQALFVALWFGFFGVGGPMAFGRGSPDVRPYFQPTRGDQIALSPDGKWVAYSERTADMVSLVVQAIDQPETVVRLPVGEDEVIGWPEKHILAAAMPALCWADADQLIYTTRQPTRIAGQMASFTALHVWDARSRRERVLVDQDTFTVFGDRSPSSPAPLPIPRPPELLAPDLSAPGSVLVKASAMVPSMFGNRISAYPAVDVFAIDTRTGATSIRASEDSYFQVILDQGGRPRFAKTRHTTAFSAESQVFSYRAGSGSWMPWTKAVGEPLADQIATPQNENNYYEPRSLPLGFGAEPDVLYFASNIGRDTSGIYAFDLETKQRRNFAVEAEKMDLASPADEFSSRPLVFDRRARLVGVRTLAVLGDRWLDPTLARVQADLADKFPRRRVEIVDWDDALRRFVILVHGWDDPGRYYLFRRDQLDGLTEFLRRAPALPAEKLHRGETFSFASATGAQLTGVITLPRPARQHPPPLLVYCHDIPGEAPRCRYASEAQAFAELGYAVVEINYRGTAGFGRQHRDAVKAAYDLIPIEDVRETVKWLASHYPVNRQRVALFGRGFGGYIALRALELHPGEFRCAVALDAPSDPAAWIFETTAGGRLPGPIARRREFLRGDLAGPSLVREAARFDRPVFIVRHGERLSATDTQAIDLRNALRRLDKQVEYWEIDPEENLGPEGQARLTTRIGEFLNEHVYDFKVKFGEIQVLP